MKPAPPDHVGDPVQSPSAVNLPNALTMLRLLLVPVFLWLLLRDGGDDPVSRVWAAMDVGIAVNPELVRRQVESAIVYGLSAAMFQEITFADGKVQQSNFSDFEALRIHQMPVVEVAILEGLPEIGGAGEPGLPPVIPALGNAIFDLTGKRLRELPFGRAVRFAG